MVKMKWGDRKDSVCGGCLGTAVTREVTAGANNTLIVLSSYCTVFKSRPLVFFRSLLTSRSLRFEEFLFRKQSSLSVLNRNRQQFSIVFAVIDYQRARNRSVIVKN